jgi:hypothetical protein
MSQEAAMRKRVEGKQAVQARTVWALEVGCIKLRCLSEGAEFVVQGRDSSGWHKITSGKSSADLLRRAVEITVGNGRHEEPPSKYHYTITTTDGRQHPALAEKYPSKDAAAAALRRVMGWRDIVVDEFNDDNYAGAYANEYDAEGDDAYAPKIHRHG